MAVTYTAQSPYQDPAFLAYLRGAGVAESDVVGEAQWRIGAIQRARGRKLPEYGIQQRRGQEGVRRDYEDRGFLNSGARAVAEQRVANDANRERSNYLAESGEEIMGYQRGAANDVAAIRRKTMEEELAARHRVGEDNATAGVY